MSVVWLVSVLSFSQLFSLECRRYSIFCYLLNHRHQGSFSSSSFCTTMDSAASSFSFSIFLLSLQPPAILRSFLLRLKQNKRNEKRKINETHHNCHLIHHGRRRYVPNFLTSESPNVNDAFNLNSTVFRLSSDGCSKTGVFLCKYKIGWPGFLRRYSWSSRSCVAIT